ncbi:MAG: mannose-6-phosphate isomerase [Chloroflexi bacterium]|nr:mannose-6-phosphate isomerase [Chloroflexota bacterium]
MAGERLFRVIGVYYGREVAICQIAPTRLTQPQPRYSPVHRANAIYPLTFTPVLRDYIWGGRRLATLYGRSLPPGAIAESWEISGHPAGSTAADAGWWAGRSLPEILAELGRDLVGEHADWSLARDRFPLLVKLLDANQDLSVQVHPDDTYALAHEGGELGKTEMWYVLHAEPGAELIHGLAGGVTAESLRAALAAGQVEKVLRRTPIGAGQAVSVPAGTVHALLRGVVVAEIQQNSDTTYRVHDWGRLAADGKPRALHVEKALEVIAFGQQPPAIVAPRPLHDCADLVRSELARNRYFVVERVTLARGQEFTGVCDGSTLEIWGCVAGEAVVVWAGGSVSLPAIRYALLPAILGEFTVSASAMATCLRVYLPADAPAE